MSSPSHILAHYPSVRLPSKMELFSPRLGTYSIWWRHFPTPVTQNYMLLTPPFVCHIREIVITAKATDFWVWFTNSTYFHRWCCLRHLMFPFPFYFCPLSKLMFGFEVLNRHEITIFLDEQLLLFPCDFLWCL